MMTSEIENIAPTPLAHLIGQRQVIRQVEVALAAAHADGRRFDHALLVGPPGLGKSALAGAIAHEMAAGYLETLGQAIERPFDLSSLLLGANDGDVIFIDEAHELRREFQTSLYLALDKQALYVNGRRRAIPIASFTLLLATTDEFRLLQPLRDRMKLLLQFQFYSIEELIQMLRQRIRVCQLTAEESVVMTIAERSRGTPRLALRLLQSCYRVCRSIGETELTAENLNTACELEQIDRLGLGPTEQSYLRLLADGPIQLNVIASLLGLPPRTLSHVTEPFLIRARLVTKDHQGRRKLTAHGREHLSNCCQIPVSFPSN